MSSLLTDLRRRLAGERGFTLIELLVSMLMSMVVLSAVLSLTEVGARSASRTTDRAETTQRARIAMTQIVQSLRSQVCPSATVPPIESASKDASGVERLTYFTEMDDLSVNSPQPTFAPQKRRMTFDPRNGGSIVEEVYNPTTTTPPFSWPASPTRTKTLATQIAKVDSGVDFLRYYGFESSTIPLTVPLSSTTTMPVPANSIAKVIKIEVAFKTRPVNGHPDAARDNDAESTIQTRNTDYTNQTNPAIQRRWGPRCD